MARQLVRTGELMGGRMVELMGERNALKQRKIAGFPK